MSRGAWVRLGLLVALVLAAVAAQVTVGLPSQRDLRTSLDGLGPWAVPAFALLYLGLSLLPAAPLAVLTIVGGAVFGFALGLPVVLVSALMGAAGGFEVSRRLGREAVERIGNRRVRRVDEEVRRHGFATVLVARLVPLVPFSTANYAFGLSGVGRREHLLATALGMLPGTALYTAVGAFGTRPGSLPFLLAVAGLVLLSLVGLLRRRIARRGPDAGPEGGEDPGGVSGRGGPATDDAAR